MGIDIKSGKIKNKGPVGHKPRGAIIKSLYKCLISNGYTTNPDDLNRLFLKVDEHQQKNKDYKINLLDGIKSFFEKNSDRFVMTVFTSDRRKNAEITLSQLGIKKYFNTILGGDSVINPKPDPEGIIKICNEVKINLSNTAYITDTVSDLTMAKNAKVSFKVGILTGLGTRSQMEKRSDLICNNLIDFSNLF